MAALSSEQQSVLLGFPPKIGSKHKQAVPINAARKAAGSSLYSVVVFGKTSDAINLANVTYSLRLTWLLLLASLATRLL